jgi:hypothetical protein
MLRDGFARRLDWDDGWVKEATLKHFVERLRPVLDDGRYAGAIDMKSLAWQSAGVRGTGAGQWGPTARERSRSKRKSRKQALPGHSVRLKDLAQRLQ